MHGQPRNAKKPEDEAASAIKSEKLRSLQSHLLHNHHNKIYSKEALDVSVKLLETNPELYTAWNYRKLAVESNLSRFEEDSDSDAIKLILDDELRVVESALRQNPKSYGAWYHRSWVLKKGHSSITHELKLLDKLQKLDARNFHAWNYRRFIAALLNRSDEEELKYTTAMIENNFSNYSAWHNRSVLLSHLLEKRAKEYSPKERVLTEEFDLVHQAIFTDPDDQSGWFYHLWLLDQMVKSDAPLLCSSWPAFGSDFSHPKSSCSDTRTYPLVLYFNQAVEGLSPLTVTVDSRFDSNEDLIWKPLSTTKPGAARSWVTHLNFSDVHQHSLEASPVNVCLGHSRGIVSSSGFHIGHPYKFAFTVKVDPSEIEPSYGQNMQKVLWGDEKFHSYEANFQETDPIASFDALKIIENSDEAASNWRIETLTNEIALFRELLSEIDCKIGKLTLARLLIVHDAMLSGKNTTDNDNISHYEEVLELLRDLVKLDPPHSGYYMDEQSLVLLRKATSSRGSLLKHLYQYEGSTFSNSSLCLRLNNLSLTRLGSIERLLWVQVLDLSHNNLRSIEGLEAMQHLSILNLGNNKLCSFSALEPLRLLESLKVLDISHNEIGMHSIDTKRYLRSSPLSHNGGKDWNFDEIACDDGVDMMNYWEAYLVFRGSNLVQVDVLGNMITDEKFNSFLVKVLPKLRWLNGEEFPETIERV